ncbi:unnamed protein product, partial [Closterium sp. NIES-54]
MAATFPRAVQESVILADSPPPPVSPLHLSPSQSSQAAPEALATMAATFPRAVQEEAFLRAVATELSKLGFK